jgi:hypothetical protein
VYRQVFREFMAGREPEFLQAYADTLRERSTVLPARGVMAHAVDQLAARTATQIEQAAPVQTQQTPKPSVVAPMKPMHQKNKKARR